MSACACVLFTQLHFCVQVGRGVFAMCVRRRLPLLRKRCRNLPDADVDPQLRYTIFVYSAKESLKKLELQFTLTTYQTKEQTLLFFLV